MGVKITFGLLLFIGVLGISVDGAPIGERSSGSLADQRQDAKGYENYWEYVLGWLGTMDPGAAMNEQDFDVWEEEMEEMEEEMYNMEPLTMHANSKVIYVDGKMVMVNRMTASAQRSDGAVVTFVKETQDSRDGESFYFESVVSSEGELSRKLVIADPQAVETNNQLETMLGQPREESDVVQFEPNELGTMLEQPRDASGVVQFEANKDAKSRATRDWWWGTYTQSDETTTATTDTETVDWADDAYTTPEAEPLTMEPLDDDSDYNDSWWRWLFGAWSDDDAEGTTYEWTSMSPYTTPRYTADDTSTLSSWWQWLKDGQGNTSTTNATMATEQWVTEELEPWSTPSTSTDGQTDGQTDGTGSALDQWWQWWFGPDDATTEYGSTSYWSTTEGTYPTDTTWNAGPTGPATGADNDWWNRGGWNDNAQPMVTGPEGTAKVTSPPTRSAESDTTPSRTTPVPPTTAGPNIEP